MVLSTTEFNVNLRNIQSGDNIILNSDLQDTASPLCLSAKALNFEHSIESNCADISGLVRDFIESGIKIHCMGDLTRGDLAAGLIELAATARGTIALNVLIAE